MEIIESDHVINHNDIYNLKCDLDRLDHFKTLNDNEKVQEYMDLIVSHVRDLIEEE